MAASRSTPWPATTGPSSASSPKPVEHDAAAGTLNGFPFHDAPTGAPILDQAAAWLDCEVRNPVDCGGHTFFVGEIVDCAFTGAEDTEVLRMEDTRMSYGG